MVTYLVCALVVLAAGFFPVLSLGPFSIYPSHLVGPGWLLSLSPIAMILLTVLTSSPSLRLASLLGLAVISGTSLAYLTPLLLNAKAALAMASWGITLLTKTAQPQVVIHPTVFALMGGYAGCFLIALADLLDQFRTTTTERPRVPRPNVRKPATVSPPAHLTTTS